MRAKIPEAASHFYSNGIAVQAGEIVILLALGANIPSVVGPPSVTVTFALQTMSEHNIRVVKVSRLYTTPAWPDPSEPTYINAVAAVETALDPPTLLNGLHTIEAQFGRLRQRPNAPRTLDIDLLDYNGRVDSAWPVLPHPRLSERAFVLVPLADVAPDWRHPVTGQTLSALLQALSSGEKAAVTPFVP